MSAKSFNRAAKHYRTNIKAKPAKAVKAAPAKYNPIYPGEPKFDSQIYKDGMLEKKYQLGGSVLNPITYNTAGIDQYRSEALRKPGQASPWAMQMNKIQGMEQDQALDDAVQGAAGANESAWNRMMTTGGMTGGSRERIANQNARNLMFDRQRVSREGMMDRANIGLQDENNRMGMLKSLPGMENEALTQANTNRSFEAGRQEFNINNTLGEIDKGRQFEMDKYNTKMGAWAADRTAGAQERAAKQMGQGGIINGLLGGGGGQSILNNSFAGKLFEGVSNLTGGAIGKKRSGQLIPGLF